MKPKALLNLIPVVAIVGLLGSFGYQSWQKAQASRPDYDNPNAALKPMQPNGNAPQSEIWQVERVIDGDTLTVSSGWKRQTLRLCGIDAPEKEQPLGKEATEKLRSLVSGTRGEVIVMPIEKDRYGRTVAEVFVKKPNSQEETFVNGEMVRSGMAYHYARFSSRCVNQEAIEWGEAIAQEKRMGVLRDPSVVKPWDYCKQQRVR